MFFYFLLEHLDRLFNLVFQSDELKHLLDGFFDLIVPLSRRLLTYKDTDMFALNVLKQSSTLVSGERHSVDAQHVIFYGFRFRFGQFVKLSANPGDGERTLGHLVFAIVWVKGWSVPLL